MLSFPWIQPIQGVHRKYYSEFSEIPNKTFFPLVDLLKTLAHPARLRVLALLRDGEHCVCQFAVVLGIPTSTVSEHLTELRRSGLLAERKDGKWVYYGLQPRAGLEALFGVLWPHLDQVDQVGLNRSAARANREIPVAITCTEARTCPGTRRVTEERHAECS